MGLVCACGILFGQGTSSRAVGTVLDPTGAPVAGANVKLTNEGTRATFEAKTSSLGTYVFDSVQVGAYSVEVDAPGFKRFVSRSNAVTIGQPTTINATLELGTLSESVEVSGSAELVQTSTSGNFGNLFSERVLTDLPIVGTRGRNPLELVLIQPGVVSGAKTGGGIHVNGARDRSWNYTLDGIDTNETSAGGSNLSPVRVNPDSIGEFRVITGNATAEFGRNSGGQVTMVTRSGTNELHGTGFYFYRTPRLNANEYAFNLDGLGKSQFVQNIYGGSIGGPIIKNKTFFFANVQALAALNTVAVTRTIFTSQARQGILRYVIGGRNQPAGTPNASVDLAGNPLPGLSIGTYNVVTNDPQRLGLDKTTQGLINAAPLANRFDAAGTDGLNTAGFTFSGAQRERQHDEVIKIDHIFNGKNTVFFRGAWGSQDTNCDNANGGLPIFPGSGCQVNTVREPRNLAATWRWNPTSRITNELVVGQNQFTFNFFTVPGGIDKITLNGPIDTTAQYDYGNLRTLRTYQFVDNLSYTRGTHTFKFGTNIRYQQHKDIRGSVGGQDVTTDVDFDTGINTVDPATFGFPTGLNTAFDQANFKSDVNFLLGRAGNISRGFSSKGDTFVADPLIFDARFPELDFYAQDNWKITTRLTIDLGLRWEIKLSPRDANNQISRPDQALAAGAPPSDSLRWTPGPLYHNDYKAIAPSLGLAWDPTGKGKTSVRANYRLAYDRLNTFSLSSGIFPNLPGVSLGVVNTDFGQGGGRLTNLPALNPPTVKPADLRSPIAFSSNSITVVDPSFKTPTTHELGFSVQHEIAKNTIIEGDYIGRRAYHLFGAYNANQAQIFGNGFVSAFETVKAGGESDLINRLTAADSRKNAGESGSQMVRRLFASQLSLNSVGAVANSLATRIQAGKSVTSLSGAGLFPIIPYPQFGGGVNVIDSNDFSTYHALSVQLQRRMWKGFEAQVSYTFSKSLDTRSFDPAFTRVGVGTNQSASSTPIDINNRRLNYAPSDFDRTHVVQSYWVYELPFGRGRRFGAGANGVVDRLVGGWQFAGLLTLESGRPFTVYSGSNTVSNVRQTPANCNGCDRHLGGVFNDPQSSFIFYFNAEERAKFSTPVAGDFGNTGRNYFRAPGFFDIDASVAKDIHITERFRFQLRADATNATNHPSFDNPTAVITSTTFGRIRGSTTSAARRIQLGAKFYF